MPLSRTLPDTSGAWYAYSADDERVWSGPVEPGGTAAPQKLSLRGLDGKVRREILRDPVAGSFTWSEDYLYRGGSLLASEAAGGEDRYYHLDHLGTPRALSDGFGGLVSIHVYWPYGEEITDPSVSDHVMQFTGHERDEMGDAGSTADDLDYMHARYYSAWVGRFLSVDPLQRRSGTTKPQTGNKYAYARNNPMKFLDPNGQEEITFQLSTMINRATVLAPTGQRFAGGTKTFQQVTIETDRSIAGKNPIVRQSAFVGKTLQRSWS